MQLGYSIFNHRFHKESGSPITSWLLCGVGWESSLHPCSWIGIGSVDGPSWRRQGRNTGMKSSCHSHLANGPLSGLSCFHFSLEFIRFLIFGIKWFPSSVHYTCGNNCFRRLRGGRFASESLVNLFHSFPCFFPSLSGGTEGHKQIIVPHCQYFCSRAVTEGLNCAISNVYVCMKNGNVA